MVVSEFKRGIKKIKTYKPRTGLKAHNKNRSRTDKFTITKKDKFGYGTLYEKEKKRTKKIKKMKKLRA